jgi:hypothetical protein
MLIGDDEHVTDENKAGNNLKVEKYAHSTSIDVFLIPI